jgi:hypothetical protein
MQKKKSQRTPRTVKGKAFSSSLTTPGMSFAAALRGKREDQQQPQTHQWQWQVPPQWNPRVSAALPQHEPQTSQ